MGIHSPSSRNFIRLENILIIGNGGRENSLAWAIQKNELVKNIRKLKFFQIIDNVQEVLDQIRFYKNFLKIF